MSNAPAPLGVFISYSHRDEDYKDDLVIHLANLKRQGKIRAWQDRDIEAGAEWDAEIKQQLESAEIILLMITPRFLASDYCFDLEMQRAVERHNEGTARVIPIIVKPCDWQGTPFSKLQVVPKDAKPITKWDDQDDAFLDVVKGIRRTVESLQTKKPRGATATSNPSSVAPIPPPQFSTYNPATFTGREAETATLTDRLQAGCRIVAIVGMTGIGKTALAERVIANLNDTQLPYTRFSLDDRSLTPDFANSGAALLRELGEEPSLEDQKDPAHLLNHLLDRLNRQPCRVQIDSLERLLRGNEQEGWSEFCDPLWLDLLQKFLAGSHCPSQLLLTTQEIPGDLDTVASRYPQFWHCEPLWGLSTDEQQILFQKWGLPQEADSVDYLSRIGEFYDGHPLVLQVIADEIRQSPFQGNIAHYWHYYETEFTAPTPTHKLARSRLFRRRVRQRVKQTIQRLPEPARRMLCAGAVFRRPVPVEFWLAMLPNGDPETAFDTLRDRHLVEYAPTPSVGERSRATTLLIKQHNLTRDVAYEQLKIVPSTWKAAERQAAHLWLNNYQPAPDAPHLETVRGYLEAFDHHCEIEAWEEAGELYMSNIKEANRALHKQLLIWGNWHELIRISIRLVKEICPNTKICCFLNLGNSYICFGNVAEAINYYKQALSTARESDDRQGEGKALGNLGIAYKRLGQFEQAIDYQQQHLNVAREIGDRQGEGKALGNLALAHHLLGQYAQAIDYQQQHLNIAREIGDRQGEGLALGNLGLTYDDLGQYQQAISLHMKHLSIAREIGDRQGEGLALGNLGLVHYSLEQYEQAINCHQKYLNIAREIGDRQGESVALGNIGENQYKLKQYQEALTNTQLSLKVIREIGNRSNEAQALKNLADLYQAMGEVDAARQYGQQALALATELSIPLKAECEALLAELGKG